jgi:serine protease Do
MTHMRGVNIGLFEFDYDMTWMAFFLDADGRVITRFGSRDHTASDSHNTPAGLLNTMHEVLDVHKEEATKPKAPYTMPKQYPNDIPAYNRIYGNTCGRCHMVNEAKWEQQRADGAMKPGAFYLYPLPETVGIKLDLVKGNKVKEVRPDTFAAKAGMRVGDIIKSANGQRVMTCADMQYVLNKLDANSKLTLQVERKSRTVEVELELKGDWRASDVSWRKSVRIRSNQNAFTRNLLALQPAEKNGLGIDKEKIAFRLNDSQGEAKTAGLMKGDIIVAFDGKRQLSLRVPQYYPLIEHAAGATMQVTVLRDGKEMTLPLRIP